MPTARALTRRPTSSWLLVSPAVLVIAVVLAGLLSWSGQGAAAAFALGIAVAAGVATVALVLSRQRRAGPEEFVREEVLAHATHPVVSTTADGTIETFSRGAERLFGRRATEVVRRMTVDGLVDPAELEKRVGELRRATGNAALSALEVLVGRAVGGDEHEESTWLARRADGTSFPARISVTPLGRGENELAGFLVMFADRTQAVAVEAHRRAVESRLAKIGSQVPGVVFQLEQRPNAGLVVTFISDGVRDVFGIEPETAGSDASALWKTVHPEDLERVRTSFDAACRELGRWQCEFRVQPRPEVQRWVWANSQPERQPDGCMLWHGFVADVTSRKQAEEAHEANRAVLQSILSSVDLGVFLVDVLPAGDFRFVEVNPAYERLSGIQAEEIRGRTPHELIPVIPAEMAACLRASFRRAAEAPGPVEYEEPFFVRGRLLWWLTRLTPLRDHSGKVVRLVGRSLDITERKAVETRVQSLTERLQLATEAAQVGIWDFDLVQNKLVCDARLLELYGLDTAGFDGTFAGWRERLHPDDRARAEQEYRDAIEGRKPYNTSFRILRPDGEEREIRARAHVQRNPAGRPVRLVAVHWDVTAERRAQAEIECARDQAEDLNRQLEDALERAHRLAQEAAAATVAKSEFLANMSHEIRTPLNAIIGMSGLLLGTNLGKDQREFSETIRSSGDGLLALVNDILDYSKIESGRLELEHRAFDLRQCVETSVDVLAGRAAEKKLDLLYAIEPGVPEAMIGDYARLRQVLVNLLSNAVKFTAKGQVFLHASVVPAQDTGRTRVRFAVHDSGIGIPAERMDRLFKTFSQVDASTTRQYGGTGLGLAISKRIVELMAGRIWVESTLGKGSTFCFEIEGQPSVAPAKPFASGRVKRFMGRRILIVDDNATSCRVLCQQAVTWGLVPRAAATAQEALSLLQRGETFDLVLVDHELADTPGLVVVKQLRAVPSAAKSLFLLMALPGQPRPGPETGVVGTINKPVKTAALFELLLEVLQGHAGPAETTVDHATALATERPLHILVAEDNPVNQCVAILMLQRLGYRADVVANGREAVEAAQRTRYDLILMDVQMPEMDGLQAARAICASNSVEQRPRIVAMTANASVGDRDRCLEAGMDDFLTKPVRAEDLRRALEETPSREAVSAA